LIRIKPGPVGRANNGPSLQERAMTFKSLLVLLDDELPCITRTQTAIRLARQLDCHLVGLAPTGRLDLPAVPARWAEHLLGGVTRRLLRSMTVPVLMSHRCRARRRTQPARRPA